MLVGLGPLAHLVPGEGGPGALVPDARSGVAGAPLAGAAAVDRSALVAEGLGLVVVDGRVASIAPAEEIVAEWAPEAVGAVASGPLRPVSSLVQSEERSVWHLGGHAVVPGLVDAHSHLLWAGDRSGEVRQRLAGSTYQDIAAAGGGIASTVRWTREAPDAALLAEGQRRLDVALRHGTTLLEAKSGYGLSTEHELRLLALGDRLAGGAGVAGVAGVAGGSVQPALQHTWLGAHAVPPAAAGDARSVERRHADYMDELLDEQLPAVVEQGIARAADVFCEPGWFEADDTRAIGEAANQAGLAVRLHVDEFADGGGAAVAADLGAETADHAGHSNEEGRAALAEAGTLQGFLPGTPHVLGSDHWPPFQACLERAQPWSLASDFNPNCHSLSLPMAGSLAVQRCGVDPLAALVAVSRNPAARLPHPAGKAHGVVVEGGVADLNVVWGSDVDGWALTPGQSPFVKTMIGGTWVA